MPWHSLHRPSVWLQLFPLNHFFSRTTRPISTKLGRKHAWGMRIQICSNKGAGPYWGPIRSKVIKLINLMNHLSECIDSWHGASLGQGDLNFVQIKSLGPCRGLNVYIVIYREMLKKNSQLLRQI